MIHVSKQEEEKKIIIKKYVEDEVEILRRLESELIIRYFDCFRLDFDRTVCIITEYCDVNGILQN